MSFKVVANVIISLINDFQTYFLTRHILQLMTFDYIIYLDKLIDLRCIHWKETNTCIRCPKYGKKCNTVN